jgi:multiple sugar transport system substrate-binding protein
MSNPEREKPARRAPLETRAVSRRRFLAGAGAVAGGVAVAACGGSNLGSSSSGGSKVVLTHYYHQYGEKGTQQAVERYAADYMKQNPNVRINIEWIPGDYTTKLNTALVGPNPPDIYEQGNNANVQLVKQGQAVPLDDLFSPADRADFFPNVLAGNTIDGRIYGLKIVTDLGLLYMRKSFLQEAGVQPPQNIAELMAAGQKLTQGQRRGLFLGNDGGIAAMYVLLPQSNGVRFLTGNQVTFATPQAAQAIQSLVRLNQMNALLLNFSSDYLQPDAFNAGATAMQWTGLWAMREVQNAIGDDFEVMAWPRCSAGGAPVTFLGGWSQIVNGHGRHVDEAKKYVKWLWIDRKDIQQDFNLSYGLHIPPRRSIAESARALQSGPARTAVNALDKYGLALGPTWDQTMDTNYQNAVSSAVKSDADLVGIQNLLTQAQQGCQQELDQELR